MARLAVARPSQLDVARVAQRGAERLGWAARSCAADADRLFARLTESRRRRLVPSPCALPLESEPVVYQPLEKEALRPLRSAPPRGRA